MAFKSASWQAARYLKIVDWVNLRALNPLIFRPLLGRNLLRKKQWLIPVFDPLGDLMQDLYSEASCVKLRWSVASRHIISYDDDEHACGNYSLLLKLRFLKAVDYEAFRRNYQRGLQGAVAHQLSGSNHYTALRDERVVDKAEEIFFPGGPRIT